LAKEESLDLWVCHHFRVLPTEDRFKRLTEDQKVLLFFGWLENPSSDQLKRHHDRRATDPVIDDVAAENFKKRGYTSDQIKRMREQLENAGYRQSY
jgi:hypothetical protein